MPIVVLLVGLFWGAYLSLMLRKATHDDMVLAALSFGAYFLVAVMALLKRKERRSFFIHGSVLLILCLAGTGFTAAFVAATDGLEGPEYVAAMRSIRFLGEVLVFFQWICVAMSVVLDRWMASGKS